LKRNKTETSVSDATGEKGNLFCKENKNDDKNKNKRGDKGDKNKKKFKMKDISK